MRVLHVVKTTNGAAWAAWQASELTRMGVEVHVALPSGTGLFVDEWRNAGAKIHIAALDFPAARPWLLPEIYRSARKLVDEIAPDLIHSHFVGTTLVLRGALGDTHSIPRIFQIPGPLHLEHPVFRAMDLWSAGRNDFWICSSRCIWKWLERSGAPPANLFLSYYGWRPVTYARQRTYALRNLLGIDRKAIVVGNISWFYAPKYYLGQRVGLKCHEDLIDALAIIVGKRPDVVGVLAGGAFGGAESYYTRLRARAKAAAGDRIKMPGYLPPDEVCRCWADFDCAIHVPLSENCGGVLEPLLAGVPTIAGNIGGLPEVVLDDFTGKVVPIRQPRQLAAAVLEVLDHIDRYKTMANNGHHLVSHMFDIRRTSREVYAIYCHLLNPAAPRPEPFDSIRFSRNWRVESSREEEPTVAQGPDDPIQ